MIHAGEPFERTASRFGDLSDMIQTVSGDEAVGNWQGAGMIENKLDGTEASARAYRKGAGMGAWGAGPFENDDAMDWAAELGESDDPGVPEQVLRELDGLAGIGSGEGCAGLAAAEAVAASRGRPYDPLPEQVREWLTATGYRAGTRVRNLALRVTDEIENGDSELRVLWDEQPDGGLSWHEAVADLRRRLEAPAGKPGPPTRAARRRVRVRTGDVVELTTTAGTFAYIQLIGEMGWMHGDLIRVLPGFFAAPLDQESLAGLIGGGEADFLSGGFFKAMITDAGGTARGNYPVPAVFAGPQPFRVHVFSEPGDWSVEFDGCKLTSREFARRYPDIDQTMVPEESYAGTGTLLRMIECGWRPWMDHRNKRWMYPKGTQNLTPPGEVTRPGRTPPYPATAVPGKFLMDRQPEGPAST